MMKMTRPRTAKGNSIQLETLWTLQFKRMWTDEDESSQTDNKHQNFDNKHQNSTQWKRELLPLAHSSRDFGLTDDWLTNHETLLHSSSSVCLTLIQRNPPTRGVSLFTMFPHQEAWERGPPSKNLYQVLRGGSSYSRFLMREKSK